MEHVNVARACRRVALTAMVLWGCATEDQSDSTDRDAGAPSIDAASLPPPPEANPIKFALHPFWEILAGADGSQTFIPLVDAKICVARKRGRSEPWDAFVSVDDGNCKTTVANQKVVLENVPAMSELILTAEKPGYVSRAIPVVTGQWDHDFDDRFDPHLMFLIRPESLLKLSPSADLTMGEIMVIAASGINSLLGGAQISLEPDVAPPMYFRGGVVVPDASATLPGDLDSNAGAIFANLPSDEYAVRFERKDVWCEVLAWGGDQGGYADRQLNVLRAPVLAGYMTVAAALCSCVVPGDAITCSLADAAADSQ